MFSAAESLTVKRKYFWFLLSLAFSVRLYKIGLVQCIAPDGVAYINAAKDLAAGQGVNPIWPPIYPWLLSGLMKCRLNSEISGQLVSVFFGALTVGLVYLIAKFIFSEKIAYISALFAVFHPYLVRYSAEVLADSTFTFFITSAVFCGWLALDKIKLKFAFLTGLLCGMAYLTKPEGFFILPIVSLWWIVGSKERWLKRIVYILFTWTIFLIISFPYLYAVKKDTGSWMISQKESIVFSVALQDEGLTQEYLNISPIEYLKKNPKEFIVKTRNGLLKLMGRFPDAYSPALFLFFILGLFGGIKEKKYLAYVFSFLIIFFIGYSIFHPGRRYLVGWVPLTLFIAGFGVEKASGWLGRGKYLYVVIILTILIMFPKTFDKIRHEGRQWKEAGLWIKSHSAGRVTVMSEDSRTAFYAGGEHIQWSEFELNKADYIVADKEINLLKKIRKLSNHYFIYVRY